MPPPPPPSKSYLLNFDSDSEDDNENDNVVCYQNDTVATPPATTRHSSTNSGTTSPTTVTSDAFRNDTVKLTTQKPASVVSFLSGVDDIGMLAPRSSPYPLHSEEEDATAAAVNVSLDEDEVDDSQDSTPDNTTAKRKRRKRKKKKRKNGSTRVDQKHVHFDQVHIFEFERCLSRDAVPGDRGWPLGLSMTLLAESSIPVDDYELTKQERLRERWIQIASVEHPQEPLDVLETRQWDYTRGSKNPLFGILLEKTRMSLLLDSCPESVSILPSADLRRVRSSEQQQPPTERFNERYPQVVVHQVRNELERIRTNRSTEGSIGCTCRKLNVYIPPPDGGKKAQHRRLSLLKVKEELRKRSLLPKENTSREVLEMLLHDTVETEPCCTSDCVCVSNGLQCQDDACTCWYWSHQASKAKQQGRDDPGVASLEAIRTRCGNRHGMYSVDTERINAFRKQYVYCQEITTSTPVVIK